ncbi:RlpA-like double-psi beta-barrel domain-containing protein [Streptomyces sp. NBC_00289]|uniref:expansin EXLX1 family cellulose-binding protein n=1 Tax=Streptomyces sp. NBC_00289 TaxID=2975703 RepID=UPI00324529A3
MATPSHRRRSRPQRRTAWVSALAVAAVALVVSLVVAFHPGGEDKAARTAATSVTGARASESPTASPSPSPSASASSAKPSSASPSAKKSRKASPSAARTTASARPSAETATRTGSASAPLAGRIRPKTTYQGVATHYDAGTGDGACSFGPSDTMMVAAMNTADYETSKACGAYVLVRAAGGASITVRIVNECPAPCRPGQLDLSKQAFAKLAALSAGQIPVSWSLLSPATSDTVSIRYKTGSSRYWCGIQALGHRNPLARLEVRTGSTWRQLPRTGYNYFLSEQGAGCGGAIRITDIYGEQLTFDSIAVSPNVVQKTGSQFAAR